MNDTIAAISTALNDSAISIIKLSGDDALNVVNRIFSRDLTKVKSHTITYGKIIDNGQEIDEVLVSYFKAPKSFTMEDVVEINCHGGVYVTRKVLALCLANGARLANNGEFSLRAYMNGRIDLTQAEAINDLIHAQNETHVRLAMNSLKGSIKTLINPLIDDILDIIAHIEVNIDYPEYDDVEELQSNVILPLIDEWLKKLDVILRRAENVRTVKQGIKTAIVGKPNVGKSSLLNALLEEDKAIVTDIAGTTRDLVEGYINLDNITLNLIDTAGIRETEDVVEKIGIDRSLQAINEAELCIVVLDGSRELDDEDKKLLELTKNLNRIIVNNKSDIAPSNEYINISASTKNIDELVKVINDMYADAHSCIDLASLNNERQIACLKNAKREMEQAKSAIKDGYEIDLVSINIQEAYNNLKDILGLRSKDDLIDTLFSKFCLGK